MTSRDTAAAPPAAETTIPARDPQAELLLRHAARLAAHRAFAPIASVQGVVRLPSTKNLESTPS